MALPAARRLVGSLALTLGSATPHWRGACCIAAALCLLAVAPTPTAATGITGAATPSPAPFVGTWTFNPELTNSLRDHSTDDRGFGEGHRRDHGGGGRTRPEGGGGGFGGGRSQGGAETGERVVRISLDADGAVVVDNGRGPARTFRPGTTTTEDQRDGKAQVAVSWNEDGNLVVESKPTHGPTRRETFIVDHERKHLYVRVSLLSTFSARTFTAAYDPADDTPTPPPS